jgi:phosphate transport system substrate-binding protein
MGWRAFELLGCWLVLGLLVGCDSGGGTAGNKSGSAASAGGGTAASSLSGKLDIQGSSTVEPISIKAKELFNAAHPKVEFSVSGQGTSNGFEALGKRECDICDASRPIKQEELGRMQGNGTKFVELPIAYDGLTVVVNKENDWAKQLTVDQLKQIFREDFAAKTWKDVDPSWPDQKISVYAPGIKSGTHDYFVEVIGKKDGKKLRSDEQTTLSEDDKQLAIGVKGDKYAIGFFGYAYFEAARNDLKSVAIVNPASGEAVSPSPQAIESSSYAPLSRPLFWYINSESMQRAEVREFVDFSFENISKIVTEAGYVPLPAGVYAAAQAHIEKGLTGPHFLTAEGEARHGSLSETYTEANLGK